ncbi:MAG: endolytic transglycosylase MltG [Clostridia bacterium]|nr:endolytic transglycosylase MltG [Clostridia bacterium]
MISGKVFKTLFALTVAIAVVTAGCVGFILGYEYVLEQNDRLDKLQRGMLTITEQTPGARMIVVPRGSDTGDIADILADADIIGNKMLFNLLSKINGFDGTYLAGTHYVTPELSYDEIMYLLSQQPKSVEVTFKEGLSYLQVKQTLTEAGVLFDEIVLDRLVNRPALFTEYDFVAQIPSGSGRQYALQGYLFPDTYKFDKNTDEQDIIDKFLSNSDQKLADAYYEAAARRGLTMDQVITLASIIEKESSSLADMQVVAGVFYNRMRSSDPSMQYLQSCATINYLREQQGLDPVLVVSDQDMAVTSPYNTYRNPGLPPGPICSPGLDAIQAALYPDSHGYYYFVADGEGNNVYARTLAEHEANIAQYYPATP